MKNSLFVTIFLCLFLVNSCSRNDDPSPDKPQAIVSFVKNVEGDYWKQIKMAIDAECAAGRLLAEAVNADASTVFAARIKNSIPSGARYDGFCEGIGSNVPIWETLNDLETPEHFARQLAGHPDAEGKINALHEEYGEGSHKEYAFTYSDIRK